MPRNIVSDIIMTCYNQTVCNLSPFQPLHDRDLKNNVRFGFYVPKNIKIDIQHVPIKKFALYPHFGLPFQSPQEADLKINIRFGFGVPKNNGIDIRRVPIKQFALYPHFGPPFQLAYGADVKIKVRFEFGITKILKLIYDVFQSNNFHFTPILGLHFSPHMGRM